MLKHVLGLTGSLSFAAMAALLVGCPSPPLPPPPPPPPDPVPTATPPLNVGPAALTPTHPAAPGSKKSCSSDADCSGGEQCQGTEGCGAPWTCGAPHPCTRDLVEWCACDGTTFRGSGSCPIKPVRHRGKC